MRQDEDSSAWGGRGEDEPREYEYEVEVQARETFNNLLAKQGVNLFQGPEVTHFRFRSDKRLDLGQMKAQGVVRSYSIAVVRRQVEVVEEG